MNLIKSIIVNILNLFIKKKEDLNLSEIRHKNIILSGSSNVVMKIITSLSSLISVPMVIGYFGKELFGLWVLITSIVGWMQLSDFGLGRGVVNILAEDYGKDDYSSASSHIKTTLIILLLILLAGILPVFIIAKYLPWGIIIKSTDAFYIDMAQNCFIIVGLFFLLNLAAGLIVNIFHAFQRLYVANTVNTVCSVLSLLAIYICLVTKAGFLIMIFCVSAVTFLGYICLWYLFFKMFPKINFKEPVNKTVLIKVSNISGPYFIFQIASLLVDQCYNIILSTVAGLTMVADYNILARIFSLISFSAAAISMPFYPAIREAYERKDYTWGEKSIWRSFFIRNGVLVAFSLPLFFIGNDLIYFWVGKAMDNHFGYLGWFFFVAYLFSTGVSCAAGDLLLVMDDIWAQLKIALIHGLVVVAALFLLVKPLGLIGVYIAAFAGNAYPAFWGFNRMRSKILQGFGK
jgi:O-antigen/teichoic acid export membrane protein